MTQAVKQKSFRTRFLLPAARLAVSLLLGTAALGAQVRGLGVTRFGYSHYPSAIEYIEQGNQWKRHVDVLTGEAPSPWQYRVLSAWIADGVIRSCGAFGVNHPVAVGFLGLRWLQNIAILLAALWLYRLMGLSESASFLGASIVAATMMQAIYDSDLSIDTYFDVLFYLLAAVAVISERRIWLLALVSLSVLNRETSLLIPFIGLVNAITWSPRFVVRPKVAIISGLGMGIGLLEMALVRHALGPSLMFEPYGVSIGVERLLSNLTNPESYLQWTVVFGIIPFLSVFGLRRAPRAVREIWWIVVPVWLLIHLPLAILAETRLFLVPTAIAFIPATLFLVCGRVDAKARERTSDVSVDSLYRGD